MSDSAIIDPPASVRFAARADPPYQTWERVPLGIAAGELSITLHALAVPDAQMLVVRLHDTPVLAEVLSPEAADRLGRLLLGFPVPSANHPPSTAG